MVLLEKRPKNKEEFLEIKKLWLQEKINRKSFINKKALKQKWKIT